MSAAIRVTTYQFVGADWPAGQATYTLTHRDSAGNALALSPNYFLLICGLGAVASPVPTQSSIYPVSDPFGTGDLVPSGAPNTIGLKRDATANNWVGTIQVWECIGDETHNGFRLLQVQNVVLPDFGAVGAQVVSAISPVAWSDSRRVTPLWGVRYSGAQGGSASGTDDWTSVHGLAEASADGVTLYLTRFSSVATYVEAITAVVYVVQWGDCWDVQRIRLGGEGNAAAVGWLAPTAIGVAVLDHAVVRARAFVLALATGASSVAPTYQSLHGIAEIGDGVAQLATEYVVSFACPTTSYMAQACVGYVLSHPALYVEWDRSADVGAGTTTTTTVAAPLTTETYGVTAEGLSATWGARAAVLQWSSGVTASAEDQAIWWPRHTASATLTATRQTSTVTASDLLFQSVDFGGVTYSAHVVPPTTQHGGRLVTEAVRDLLRAIPAGASSVDLTEDGRVLIGIAVVPATVPQVYVSPISEASEWGPELGTWTRRLTIQVIGYVGAESDESGARVLAAQDMADDLCQALELGLRGRLGPYLRGIDLQVSATALDGDEVDMARLGVAALEVVVNWMTGGGL